MNKYNIIYYNNGEKYEKELKRLKHENFNYRNFFLLFIFLFISISLLANVDRSKLLTRTRVLGQSIKFMKKCFNGELLNNNIKIKHKETKISTIIPVYNCQKTIKAAVRSIQNQNMSDIEIILVNDNSNFETSLIIEKLASEDQRIKILNNKKNMATLYSRNIGILNAKGKYIMNLDNDDLFMDFDVFDKVYEEAEKGNYDIIGFMAIECQNYSPLITQMHDSLLHIHRDGLILYQPELAYFSISSDKRFNPNDIHVWGRLTKTNVYKKSINNFGKNAIGEIRNLCFVTWNEDCAMSMVLLKYAKSYKFIQIYGIFHYIGITTSSNTSNNDLKRYGELFFLDTVFDFSQNNTRGKKFSIDIAHKKIFTHINNFLSVKNKKYLKAILNKMLYCQYISFDDKKEIKKNLKLINE